MTDTRRFKVALSFPGEKRNIISQVAEKLAIEYGKKQIFYDFYHKVELAKPNMDIVLMNNYGVNADLVVVFLCKEYDEKEWCGVEWRVIRDMIKKKRYDQIMPLRFDDTEIEGFLSIDGYIFVADDSPQQIAEYIIERLRINEDAKPKVTGTKSDLQNIESKLAQLTDMVQSQVTNPDIEEQKKKLIQERDTLRAQLLQSEEVRKEQEKIKKELEQSLSKQKESETLKKQAFDAVEEKEYGKAKELLKESAKDKIIEVAEDFYQIGNVSELNLEYRDALHYYELAAKIAPDNVDYLDKAGRLSRDLGYVDNALRYLEKAISIVEQDEEKKEPLAIYYNEVGLVWKLKGEYDVAIKYYNLGIEIAKELYGDYHTNIAARYNNLGNVWSSKGEYDKAIGYYEKALVIDNDFYGESHPIIAIRYNNLGMAWSLKGEYDKAIGYYEQALEIDKEYYGASHPAIAIRYSNLGATWDLKGEYDKAIDYYEQALEIGKEYYGASHPAIAIRYNNLGATWHLKGEYDKAIDYYEKELEIMQRFLGEEHPSTKTVKSNRIAKKNEKE